MGPRESKNSFIINLYEGQPLKQRLLIEKNES
jgi:hypothetical protein